MAAVVDELDCLFSGGELSGACADVYPPCVVVKYGLVDGDYFLCFIGHRRLHPHRGHGDYPVENEANHGAENSGGPGESHSFSGGVFPVGKLFVAGFLAWWAVSIRHGAVSFHER